MQDSAPSGPRPVSPNTSSAYLTISCPAAPTICRKSWPAKSPVANRRAHLAAVDRDRGAGLTAILAPFGDDFSRIVEQRQPAGHALRAVAGPVIRGDEARVQCRGVAKEREIGREIQRVEIDAAVGQPLRRQAHRIEAEDPRRFRQRRRKLPDQPLGVERGDEDRARAASRQVGYRAGAMAEQLGADSGDILDVYRFDLASGRSRRSRRTRTPRRADRQSRPGRTLPAKRPARGPGPPHAGASAPCTACCRREHCRRSRCAKPFRDTTPRRGGAQHRVRYAGSRPRGQGSRSSGSGIAPASERQLQAESDEAERDGARNQHRDKSRPATTSLR